jgi:chromosome transmission fidelity protein 8
MPEIPIHIASHRKLLTENPLPSLLHTPSGLAIIELQATIHFPQTTDISSSEVGKLVFPLYNPDFADPSNTKWMKQVYFYVGKHQRMTGEVKKLAKPFAVIRKRQRGDAMQGIEGEAEEEELEIVDIVRYKILFATRPEPVGGEQVLG